MRTILIRTLSGAVFVALILGSLIANEHAFALVLFLLNFIALKEFQQFSKNNTNANATLIISVVAFTLTHFVFVSLLPVKWLLMLTLAPLLIATVNLFSKSNKNPISNIGFSILGLVYISFPLILLNLFSIDSTQKVPWLILSMFVIIWTNDSFAFLSGLAFGKHKLFERVSPKKTWEGFIGGFIVALIAGYFLHAHVDGVNLIPWLVLTGIIAISSVIGDFIESLFKRTAGIKDSGKIMPGHGGILDRIDSLLFVVPVMYIYLQLIR